MLVGRGGVSVAEREAVVAWLEITIGGRAGRHTHPGDEISYVMEGCRAITRERRSALSPALRS